MVLSDGSLIKGTMRRWPDDELSRSANRGTTKARRRALRRGVLYDEHSGAARRSRRALQRGVYYDEYSGAARCVLERGAVCTTTSTPARRSDRYEHCGAARRVLRRALRRGVAFVCNFVCVTWF